MFQKTWNDGIEDSRIFMSFAKISAEHRAFGDAKLKGWFSMFINSFSCSY